MSDFLPKDSSLFPLHPPHEQSTSLLDLLGAVHVLLHGFCPSSLEKEPVQDTVMQNASCDL